MIFLFFLSLYIITAGGHLLIGFLDRETELGRTYQEHRAESVFYRMARFLSSEEVAAGFEQAGFGDLASVQTICSSPGSMERLAASLPGHGSGLFVVMRGSKAQT